MIIEIIIEKIIDFPLTLKLLFVIIVIAQIAGYFHADREGRFHSAGKGIGIGKNAFSRKLASYTGDWYKVKGTVIDVKVETYGDIRLYRPVFSYTYLGMGYTSIPKANYHSDKYPVGTAKMLLLPQKNPLDISVLDELTDFHPVQNILFTAGFIVIYMILF